MVFKYLILLLALLLVGLHTQPTNPCHLLHFLPMPKQINCGNLNKDLQDPCKLFFHVKVDQKDNQHINELISFQMKKSFNCDLANYMIAPTLSAQLKGFSYLVTAEIKIPALKSVFTTGEQKYQLTANEKQAIIRTDTYVGFVWALQTFIQSIQCPRNRYNNCTIAKLPLEIRDQPAFTYRGLMVDTSRHFLPVHLIYQTIDAMMYNKMNILHWHITDQDSFPLILQSHPELAKYAAYSPEETYTADQARKIVQYAKQRGVRVIPELDTPGHAASWGLAPQNLGVACTFGTGFMGPLDVTLDKTYTLVKEVFAEIFDIFSDPMVHLGGDEVVLACFANKTQFIQKQQIQQQQMERHYRKKQHAILTQLNPSKRYIYWMNGGDMAIQSDDIVHWWGGGLPNTKNKIIISIYGPFYLDMGVGNYLGVSYGSYQTWLDLYQQDIGKMIEGYENKDNVLGAEVCLWSELSNKYTHHIKIWMRTSAFAERVWTTKEYTAKPDTLGRLSHHQRLMQRRGIPTSPATSQQCETFPQYC